MSDTISYFSTRTVHELVAEFTRQVMHKPDLSEIQATLQEFPIHLPEITHNSDYRAVMASCYMLAGPMSFSEMSDLVYAYEKRIDFPTHYFNLIAWMKEQTS